MGLCVLWYIQVQVINSTENSPSTQSSPLRPGMHWQRPVTGSFWAPAPHSAARAQSTPYRPAGHAVATETHTRHLSSRAITYHSLIHRHRHRFGWTHGCCSALLWILLDTHRLQWKECTSLRFHTGTLFHSLDHNDPLHRLKTKVKQLRLSAFKKGLYFLGVMWYVSEV